MSDINVFVTSNLTSSERRISPQWSMAHLKERLETITGIKPENQTLHYYPNQHSNVFSKLSTSEDYITDKDKDTFLTSLNLNAYSRIHVIDEDPDSAVNELSKETDIGIDNNNNEPEFKLSEAEYVKRADSALQWKKENRLGRFDPNYEALREKEQQENKVKLSEMKVGDRCRTINIEGERRGVVRYIGKIQVIDQGESDWVGIEFDEPVGRNDGSIAGFRVFECRPGHGSFVKPKQVEVGDFPELDPFASDSEEEL
ncbi:uncharacterized protein J8A68_003209 [[Candida] subhashii]|uniref:CAP-Gly domain-containing protein n=1 Tax=[Candida] subhashii TaxID=561895 RepID=A0A8J5QW33_9ASCO|nr:uncharacterized protein J8A68_003209 [[Candida] subhashii]KAG7663295.1 hypothetical protein J8A68_003209 [[Candida] subhashii]